MVIPAPGRGLIRALTAAAFIWPATAQAGGIAGIANSAIREGQLTLTSRTSFAQDNDRQNQDNRLRTRLMSDYGVNDWFAVGLFAQGDRRDGKELELDAVISQLRFEFTTAAKEGFFSGLWLRYTYRDGDKKPDNAHARFLIGAPVDNWEFRYNQIVYHEFGPDSRTGLGLDTRLQATYGYHPRHRAGIESFSDLGVLRETRGFDQQQHTLGPVFTGQLTDRVNYETGYAYGISRAAPDHNVKLFLIVPL